MILDNDPLGIRSIDIKYEGSTKATQYCIDDFMKRLYGSRKITDMTILTCEKYHALMLCFENRDIVVFIKSGLTSGYSGEGPKGTSLIIRLAEEAGITIKEMKAAPSLFKRINSSRATVKDVIQWFKILFVLQFLQIIIFLKINQSQNLEILLHKPLLLIGKNFHPFAYVLYFE